MPVWHEKTKGLVESGDLAVVGIVQEQHPDRARLFMQWHEMDWPIMVDPLNLLGVRVVPIHVLIDEAGIVRGLRPRAAEFEAFMAAEPAEHEPAAEATAPDVGALADAASTGRRDPSAQVVLGDALFLWGEGRWGGTEMINHAIEAYESGLRGRPDDGAALFKLGVASLARFESSQRQSDDFSRAIEAWTAARSTDPNQYIWRRRIQQYGPRLDKPYSFYDWINQARADIEARGETPVPLREEPRGAELARPARALEIDDGPAEAPDPEGEVDRDDRGLIGAHVIVVPHTDRGDSARVHVVFTPSTRRKAHWNNEGGGLELWLSPPDGVEVDRRVVRASNRTAAVSTETRRLEFEARRTGDAASGPVTIAAYALYYVCEDADGLCLFRRQDLEIELWPEAAGDQEGDGAHE